jgi:hypothetical protein
MTLPRVEYRLNVQLCLDKTDAQMLCLNGLHRQRHQVPPFSYPPPALAGRFFAGRFFAGRFFAGTNVLVVLMKCSSLVGSVGS